MKFNILPPLKMLILCIVLIFQFSCSKDSDLLTDYVLADTLDKKSIEGIVVDDTYQVSLTGSMVLDVLANDTFENGAEVEITETSSPTNGTVAINNDETLTYTPNAEIVEQVSDTTTTASVEVVDTFTYTAEVVNEDGTATSEEASVVITTEDNSTKANGVSNISPWDYCQDGQPIGGGTGMDSYFSSVGADYHITTNITPAAFKVIVEGATSGERIFIDSGVTIDLTGISPASNPTIDIPGGVIISSDRGVGVGALIKTDDMAYLGSGNERPAFNTIGSNVRFTGIRFQGPYGLGGVHGGTDDTLRRAKWGISSTYDNLEVDNCEIYNWPRAAITLGNYASTAGFFGINQPSTGHLIHNNYIHNNRQNNYGYGVDVSTGAEAKIYANVFSWNRHDIAGYGHPTLNSYEAYCNTVLGPNTHHNFDMHPEPSNDPDNPHSGAIVHIHHNDFQDDASDRGINNDEFIRITGTPTKGAIIEYNRFERVSKIAVWTKQNGVDAAIQQRGVNPTSLKPVNITWNNNTYNGEMPAGQTIRP